MVSRTAEVVSFYCIHSSRCPGEALPAMDTKSCTDVLAMSYAIRKRAWIRICSTALPQAVYSAECTIQEHLPECGARRLMATVYGHYLRTGLCSAAARCCATQPSSRCLLEMNGGYKDQKNFMLLTCQSVQSPHHSSHGGLVSGLPWSALSALKLAERSDLGV